MFNSIKIEVEECAEGFYVYVNGETLFECLSAEEVSELTLADIDKHATQSGII